MPDPNARPARHAPTVDELADGVRAGHRALLGRAITLVESNSPKHQARAQELLNKLLPETGGAQRIGITGTPGVGKSTFIDAFGTMLSGLGHRVAVLAVDPSSTRTGGSILGDKTRMARLSVDERAFIRPSPSAGSLGGVTRRTRETMLLCEAAGYDVVLVETVGVGQSETLVAGMVDFFLVLMLPGAGDELQGIKRGILEIADMIAINKADGDLELKARAARAEYEGALHFMRPVSPHWNPPVLTCSALRGAGLSELWDEIQRHRQAFEAAGELEEKRRRQRLEWMWSLVERRLSESLQEHAGVRAALAEIEAGVLDASLAPTWAAERILELYRGE